MFRRFSGAVKEECLVGAVCLEYAALWLPIWGGFGESFLRSGWFSKASNPGEGMIYVTRQAGRAPVRGFTLSGTIALCVGAFSLSCLVAVWTEGFGPVTPVSDAASPKDITTSTFDDRFSAGSAPGSLSAAGGSLAFVRSWPSKLEIEFRQAKNLLAQKLQSQDPRLAFAEATASFEDTKSSIDGIKPSIEASKPSSSLAGVPLPRSRPAEASLAEWKNDVPTARAENRTLLEKLSDLLPGRVTLASLAPDGGLLSRKPDLAAMGYDSVTAVYDISARTVYMPDGSKLEAHSGYGSLMDDPAHVGERMVGATPPTVYDLRPREAIFHGVQALRMIPVEDNSTLGRSGLLVHPYMLGPNGDSNGCVSVKNYDKFLKAFSNGEVKRLVVVPRLGDEKLASHQAT